jgi:PAS domain S-box-containing protein
MPIIQRRRAESPGFEMGRDAVWKENERLKEALGDAERTIRALLDATAAAVFLLDRKGKILLANNTVLKRSGKSRDEILGTHIADLMGPEDSDLKKKFVLEVIHTGRPVRFEDEWKGTWTENDIQPIFDSQGKIARLVLCSRDITERKRAEEVFKNAHEELEGKYKTRTEELQRLNDVECTPPVRQMQLG